MVYARRVSPSTTLMSTPELPTVEEVVRLRLQMPDTTRVDAGSGRHQCIARTAGGSRCVNPPMHGQTLCVVHGKPGHTNRLALNRIVLAMVSPALEVLYRATNLDCHPLYDKKGEPTAFCAIHGDTCPDWNVKVNAAKALLDRAGYGPKQTLQIENGGPNITDLAEMSDEELAAYAEGVAKQIREEPKALPDARQVLEGELVANAIETIRVVSGADDEVVR